MRKLFRFKYEPCKGDCYAWCDSLPEELNKLSDLDRRLTVELMVKAHDRLCDNPDYSFGIDREDSSGMFVAHFRTPKGTDTFLHNNFKDSVKNIAEVVFSHDIPAISDACKFGKKGAEDLGKEIIKACVDLIYREEHHKNCPCTKTVNLKG